MKDIFITGSSGFIGTNLKSSFNKYSFCSFNKGENIIINSPVVIHLAGKAHDTNKTSISKDYYESNTELTKQVFDSFLKSNAKVFIMISSVKAVADSIKGLLYEDHIPNPQTHYGKSKLLAENYILSKKISKSKRFYILRPCMIHGPGNKGNLNLLYNIISKSFPWPLGAFENNRSFCSIDNLLFVINEFIINEKIESGIYNVADDDPLSTNEIISLISKTLNKKPLIWKMPKSIIHLLAKIGDKIKFPLNSEKLKKLTESYLVSNKKLIDSLGKNLPLKSEEGMTKTFKSF